MGYTIEIGEGADKLTLDTNIRFNINWGLETTDVGIPQRTTVLIEAEGKVVGTASDIIDTISDYSLEVTEKTTARPIRILLDNVEKFNFTVADAVSGPTVTQFRTVNEADGSGESYMRWELTAFVLIAANTEAGGEKLLDLQRSLEVTINAQGLVVRKVWRATAKATSASAALARILTFKPSEPRIREITEIFPDEGRATGVWIWEAQRNDKFVQLQEEIEVTGIPDDYVIETQVNEEGTAPPVLHKMSISASVITIRGWVKGYDRLVPAPPPHFTESPGSIVRARARERTYFPVTLSHEDALIGLYTRQYEEVWIAVGPFSEPDHGDHAEIQFLLPPPNGPLVNE